MVPIYVQDLVMMPHESKAPGLEGTVLAADPTLLDPNFQETLVFVARHDPDGAMGLVLNRPFNKTLGEIVPDGVLSKALVDIPVLYGGPVQPGGIILGFFSEENGIFSCRLDSNLEQAEAAVAEGAGWVRAFAGHSGWSEGQLENELAGHSWKVCHPDPILFEATSSSGLWNVFVSGDERWRSLLSFLPKDPSRN